MFLFQCLSLCLQVAENHCTTCDHTEIAINAVVQSFCGEKLSTSNYHMLSNNKLNKTTLLCRLWNLWNPGLNGFLVLVLFLALVTYYLRLSPGLWIILAFWKLPWRKYCSVLKIDLIIAQLSCATKKWPSPEELVIQKSEMQLDRKMAMFRHQEQHGGLLVAHLVKDLELTGSTQCNDLGKLFMHTCLSPSSIIWYWHKQRSKWQVLWCTGPVTRTLGFIHCRLKGHCLKCNCTRVLKISISCQHFNATCSTLIGKVPL